MSNLALSNRSFKGRKKWKASDGGEDFEAVWKNEQGEVQRCLVKRVGTIQAGDRIFDNAYGTRFGVRGGKNIFRRGNEIQA